MDIEEKVYELVARIPRGNVATYGQIAKYLHVKSPRLVGKILHQNKDPQHIPCHRVVFADGRLSRAYAFGGYEKQKEKLLREGVLFKGDKVDIKNSTKTFF